MVRRLNHIFLLCLLLPAVRVSAQELVIVEEDTAVEQRVDGGFHLFIKKKPGINSVLLTESTRDPAMRQDNFAYRSAEWNAVNGDEIRVLDGVPIPREDRIWSLIDSTPEEHPTYGTVFHIYIPYILYYGYESTRHGEVYVVDGTYFNIRAFSLPYADYRSSFRDNPFILRVRAQQPLPGPPEGNYMKETINSFSEIAKDGKAVYATDADLVDTIRTLLLPEQGKSLDLVICLDTTGSMKKKIDAVKENLIATLNELLPGFPEFRIGMVLYRDYHEEYLYKKTTFTKDFNLIQTVLNGIQVRGGGDTPEAVHEALHEAATGFPWEAQSRMIVLVGDAPAHLRPRAKITKEMVDTTIKERNIKVHAIILPQ